MTPALVEGAKGLQGRRGEACIQRACQTAERHMRRVRRRLAIEWLQVSQSLVINLRHPLLVGTWQDWPGASTGRHRVDRPHRECLQDRCPPCLRHRNSCLVGAERRDLYTEPVFHGDCHDQTRLPAQSDPRSTDRCRGFWGQAVKRQHHRITLQKETSADIDVPRNGRTRSLMKCWVASQASIRRPWQWPICFFPGCTHSFTKMRKGGRSVTERQERYRIKGDKSKQTTRVARSGRVGDSPTRFLIENGPDAGCAQVLMRPSRRWCLPMLLKELGSGSAIKRPGG
jgi:hypothetical protein